MPAKGDAKGGGKGGGGKGGGKKGGKPGRDRSKSQGPGGGGGGAGATDPNAAVDKNGKKFCYFHNHGGCSRENCNFSHDTPPKKVKDGMTRPTRNRSSSPGGGNPGPKAKAKGKARPKSRARTPAAPAPAEGEERQPKAQPTQQPKFGGMKKLWCPFFLKGKCKMGDKCPMPHVNEAAKNSLQAAIQNAAEASKS